MKPSSEGVSRLAFELVRNVTSADEKENGSRTLIANLPAREILKIDTEHNLRDYIPAHEGKRRNGVHNAIAATIKDNPSRFITLHSGFVISASDVTIDDDAKVLRLKRASLINGAQSQGEIKRYFEGIEDPEEANNFLVRAEIIVEPDSDFVVETAIARNTSTQVTALSRAGKKKAFDKLELGFQKTYPDYKLRKSETDTEPDFIDTERLLQLCTALMPPSLVQGDFIANKVKAYKQRAQCRADFEDAAFGAEENSKGPEAKRHQFYVDIAAAAWEEYNHWRAHPGWAGKYLQERTSAIARDSDGNHTVADGIVFPILGALALFVKQDKGRWTLEKPKIFREEMMIDAALSQLRTSCGGRVYLMGRQAGVYESLSYIPKMVLDVMKK